MIEQSKVERDQDACLAPGSEITVDRRSTEAKSPSPAWPPQVTLLTSSTSIFFFNTHYQAFTDIFCRSQIWHLLQILILLRSSNGYHENITVQTPFILRTKPGPHPKRRYEWHALRNHGSTPHELGVLKASSHLETSPDPWYYPVFLGFRILQSEISPSANLASPIANVTEFHAEWVRFPLSSIKSMFLKEESRRADAITKGTDGRLYFVEPLTSPMTMKQFLATLASGGTSASADPEVHYLQSQNGNLFCSTSSEDSEFESFLGDIPKDLPWCTEVLGRQSSTFAELRFTMYHNSGAPPDAVNLWIGDGRSVTSIHSDPYENVYCVIRGSKTFTLLPPTEGWCMRERTYPHAKYERTTRGLEIIPSGDDVPPIRWSSVLDPTTPGLLPPEAHPISITVSAGECLYLPAGWWHYVEQNNVTIAVNYWYDIEGRGASFPIFGSEAQHQIVHLQAYLRLRLFTSLTKPAMGKDKSEKKEKKEKKQKEVKEDTKVNEDVEMVDAVEVPTEKKSKKDKEEIVIPIEDLSPIAHPLAQKKLLKKLHKTIKRASKSRQVKRGVKEVVKGIRKGEKGLLILAADITPIDIISHLPVLSEDAGIPYVFIPSKEELGHASATKRPTSCVMICPNQKKKPKKDSDGKEDTEDYRELYEECRKEIEKLDQKVVF
ncbi:hypothetical protein NLI96_g8785 [Meripilus lineatus]|uniref:JmjC domain-containing protein n=1 Tax=Meripilus lineatus TaxID=2056292 RepID=A0AAD5UYZ5_9APHY|nr:hypothetical protein NLI96_g8785 [Physisporinus lineatus]